MENRKLISQAVRYALTAGVAASMSYTPLASAAGDQGTQELGQITVTGSRIKRTDVETAQPVLQIDRQTIMNTGITNIGQLLQNITSAGAGLNTVFNNGGNGNTYINLRYLGGKRVLVLLNGKRFNTTLSGYVNLNNIPISIVDHIEVLQDGASAIYGSDAISGVVNIITRQNFNGATASAYYGKWGDDGGWAGATSQFDFSIGTSNDHSGLFFSSQYRQQKPLWASARDYAAVPIHGTGTDFGSSGTPQGRFIFYAPSGVKPIPLPANNGTIQEGEDKGKPYPGPLNTGLYQPVENVHPIGGLTSTQCPTVNIGAEKLNPAKGMYPYYIPSCDLTLKDGANGDSPSDFRPFQPADHYNFAPSNYLLTPLETTSLYVQGHYDLSPNVTFQSDVLYNHQYSEQNLAATPLFITPGSIQGNIPASNNPFGFALNTTQPLGDGYDISNLQLLGRREVGAGDRNYQQNKYTYRFQGGFLGNFLWGNRVWNWDASYIFGRSAVTSRTTGLFNTPNLLYALNGCPDTDFYPTGTKNDPDNGCVPYNMFNGAANVSDRQAAYATYIGQSQSVSTARIYNANITTSNLFQLPAGGLGLAVGYEYRQNEGTNTPGPILMAGSSSGSPGVPILPTEGGYTVNSEYIELNVPLLANVPGARQLSLDLANRWFDYSSFGSGTAGKVGLKWQPIHDLLLRATWSEGFRAPNINELYGGHGASFPAVTDPCNGGGTTAVQQKNCAGVPASYQQPNLQIREIYGGNPNLQPETSTSRTAGFVYSPSWLPGLSVNLDYYKIEIENTIQQIGAQNLFDFCYSSTVPTYCQFITRNSFGNPTRVLDLQANIGGTYTSGFDGGIQYKFPSTGFGDFTAKLNSTYVQNYDLYFPLPSGGKQVTHVAGTAGTSNGFGSGIPDYKTNLEVDWAYGGWNASVIAHYISAMTENCPADYNPYGLCTWPEAHKNNVGAVVWWDAQVGYDFVAANTSVTFGMLNVFNHKPPLEVDVFANSFDPTLYPNLIGRFPYLRVTTRF